MTHTGLSAEAVWGVLEPLPGWERRPRGLGAQTFGRNGSYVNLYDTGRVIVAIDPGELKALAALAQLIANAAEDGGT